MSHSFKLFLSGIVALGLFGCAEGASSEIQRPDSSTTQQIDNGNDIADCIFDGECENNYNPRNEVYRGPFEGNRASNIDPNLQNGFFDIIDSLCHKISTYYSYPYAGDVDILGIEADAGTPLKISATAYDSGLLKPVLTVYDAEGKTLTESMDNDRNGEATIYLYAPTNDRFYVSVEERQNYEKGWAESCQGSYAGGKRFGYILKVENAGSQITARDLGDITDVYTYSGHISKNGEVQYLNWRAPKGSSFSIAVSTTPDVYHLALSPIDREDGKYRWYNTGDQTLVNKLTLRPGHALESGDNLIFTLAVADEIGHADYDYTLTITSVQ
ncbi:MAG: hypothetical protein II767_06470 [Proteobacteria bacterium]|nr:hypothetical protein [Pseudomonadota bacterium]